MSDFENVEDLIQRCTFHDFGMGQEPWDYVKARLRQRDYPATDESPLYYLKTYAYEPILVEVDRASDKSIYLVNGLEVATWHTQSSNLAGYEDAMLIGEVPHRDHPEERTKVYCCDVYDMSKPFNFYRASEHLIRRFIEHECLENFYIDGVRVFDPHAGEKKGLVVL